MKPSLFLCLVVALTSCAETAPGRPELVVPVQLDLATGAIAGGYYRGDGLGFNLHLELVPDGTFECKWTGCLGEYGNSSGRWSQVGDQVSTTTLASDGLLTSSPLGNLQVLEDGSEKRLLQLNDREFYDKWGPDRFSCFSRVK